VSAAGEKGMLSFSTYTKTVNKAVQETDEGIVNLILRCIYKPAGVVKKKGEEFHIDKATASHYLNANPDRPIHREIIKSSGIPLVVDNAAGYFTDYICPLIIPAMQMDMIDELSKLIKFDATISESKKTELLVLANEEMLADFLASILLYVVNKPNIVLEAITSHNNLLERNKYFTGRAEQFTAINDLFRSKENSAVNICQTVSGLGGIGKTQLAIEYAYLFCGKFKNCIWFINAETDITTQNYFLAFAAHFNIVLPPEYKPEDLQRTVKLWLKNNKKWLLIFDNLESIDVVKPYLPEKINGRIIITTRNARIDFGNQIALGVFNIDEAILFLKKRLSNDKEMKMEFYNNDANDFDNEAPNLIKRLGFLPLALEQAAAYIRETKSTITSYLNLLSESGLLAFEEKYAKPEYYEKAKEFEKIVTATWNISFKAIACEGSRQLLNLCAYMAPDRIPVAFFAETREKLPSPIKEDMAETITRTRIVTELRIYSLTSGNADYINVHRLVQEVIRKNHKENRENQPSC